jgi:hypothetical protein
MSFLTILRECNLDFNKAKEIFYNLTDLQISWLNYATTRIQENNTQVSNKNNSFGKSFNLRE